MRLLPIRTFLVASCLVSDVFAFVPSSLEISRAGPGAGLGVASAPRVTAADAAPGDPSLSASDGSAEDWSPESWKRAIAKQMPVYESASELEAAVGKLERVAPLVFAGEVRSLHEKLGRVSQGQGFVLMGGDCAESFKEFHVNHIRDTFQVMMQMALVMTFGSAMPIVKVGRMAG